MPITIKNGQFVPDGPGSVDLNKKKLQDAIEKDVAEQRSRYRQSQMAFPVAGHIAAGVQEVADQLKPSSGFEDERQLAIARLRKSNPELFEYGPEGEGPLSSAKTGYANMPPEQRDIALRGNRTQNGMTYAQAKSSGKYSPEMLNELYPPEPVTTGGFPVSKAASYSGITTGQGANARFNRLRDDVNGLEGLSQKLVDDINFAGEGSARGQNLMVQLQRIQEKLKDKREEMDLYRTGQDVTAQGEVSR